MTDPPRDARKRLLDPEWAELEGALEAPPPPAPAMFTERVMARVAVTPQRSAQGATGWMNAPALEWWVQAAADPAVALALLLAALLLWRPEFLVPAFEAGAAWLRGGLAAAAAPLSLDALQHVLPLGAFAHALPQGPFALALTLALLPGVAWGSWRLFLWYERASLPRSRVAGPR